MKKHATKHALLTSILSLLLCVSMLVSTTFAWFTDEVTSANNIIKSGNLDVEMYWADGTEAVPTEDSGWTDASQGAIFDYDNWEPGYTQVRHIKIANEGSLALKYKVSILANGAVTELADVIDVYYMDPADQVANRTDLTEANKLDTLAKVLTGLGESGNGELAAGAADTITIAFKMQESVGNKYMNKSIGTDFSVVLNATQLTAENDSFGMDYDTDAVNPVYSEYVQRVENPEAVSLGDNTMAVDVPAAVIEELPDDVTSFAVKYAEKRTDTENNTVAFTFADLIDQDGTVIDLTDNTVPVTVKVYVGETFESGHWVKVFHDNEKIATVAVDGNGYITYETLHFCEITVADNIIHVSSADDLIKALTEIKDRAKKQIPGAEGNKAYRENAVFVLENDITVEDSSKFMYTDSNGAPFHFYGVKGVLDLNGHNITVSSDALLNGKAHANAVLLFQYSNMVIQGEGRIIANNKSIPVYAWANCTVDIYGGDYITNASERNESAVYVNNATALVHVYGGTYTNSAYAFNAHDTSANAPAIVLHEGIVYADYFNSSNKDLTLSDLNGGRIVIADGCVLSEYESNGIGMNKVIKN